MYSAWTRVEDSNSVSVGNGPLNQCLLEHLTSHLLTAK